jgi:RNA polymerase sigma-70 factor, ECF subfamily
MSPRFERFRRLIEPHHDAALGFARNLCRSRADGDDLFQEAAVRALAKLDQLRDDALFRGWLYRVIVSVHRNRCRAAFWRRLVPIGTSDYPTTWSTDEALGAAERARIALATLPADQRETIVLFEIEGWQIDEIARIHDVSESAVKSRLSRGRERLRTFYERHAPVAAPDLVPGETP